MVGRGVPRLGIPHTRIPLAWEISTQSILVIVFHMGPSFSAGEVSDPFHVPDNAECACFLYHPVRGDPGAAVFVGRYRALCGWLLCVDMCSL